MIETGIKIAATAACLWAGAFVARRFTPAGYRPDVVSYSIGGALAVFLASAVWL